MLDEYAAVGDSGVAKQFNNISKCVPYPGQEHGEWGKGGLLEKLLGAGRTAKYGTSIAASEQRETP